MNISLEWSCSEPGGGGGCPQERGHLHRTPPQSANIVIPDEWGRAGAGSKPVLEPAPTPAAATTWYTQACPWILCVQRADPLPQHGCGQEHRHPHPNP